MSRPKIRPKRWVPPRATRGHRPPHLPQMRLITVPGYGTEDVLVDDAGRVITGTEDGRIFRISADGGVVELLAMTGGRPLGIE
ncbi:MAG: SMP-30/gluconolactonase/LRE family protein, partial [Nocardioidaceae bacterium]